MRLLFSVSRFRPQSRMMQLDGAIASLNAVRSQVASHVEFSRGTVSILFEPPSREQKGYLVLDLTIPTLGWIPEECRGLMENNTVKEVIVD